MAGGMPGPFPDLGVSQERREAQPQRVFIKPTR